MYKIGEIIAVQLSFWVEHYGIYVGNGRVISASQRLGRVAEEDLSTFSSGKAIISKGYPSDLHALTIISKAKQLIGKKWNFLTYNCQHFATQCHGTKSSPQLDFAYGALILIGGAYFLSRGKIPLPK